jgi:exodeoxyribonuclease V beta subunit
MMLNKYGFELSDEMVEEIEKRIKSLVDYKPFQTLLQGAKISKEQPLKYKNNLRYIDLLLELEDGSFVVIDYKTSQNFASKHKAQVRSYIKAVQEITSKEVKGYLCYLLEDGITLIQV